MVMDDDLPEWSCKITPEDIPVMYPPVEAVYRTSNGSRYEFSFETQNDFSRRVYIESMPSYGNRDTSLIKTHRLYYGDRPYVCWDRPLYDLDEAKKVAAEWSKRTDRYIKTGKPFES